jgi:predicted ATPase
VGLGLIDSELAIDERNGQRSFSAELHRARGEILLQCQPRDATAAEATFKRAIEIARGQSAKMFELQATISLGRLWLAQGKRARP